MPVRAAPKVGRNELCPCGSGKKYKRCCADRPAAAPIGADPSRAERLRTLEPRLEYEQVRSLTRADLARLDLSRLRDATVVAVMRRQAQLRDWRRACLAVDELARRGERELADEHLQDTIRDALDARQDAVAAELLARCGQTDHPLDLQLRLALARRDPEALARLEAAALDVASDSDELGEADVAHAVLMTSPALGLLVARGALRGDALLDGEMLLEAIDELQALIREGNEERGELRRQLSTITEVIDLVTRGSLMTTLKRLRSA